MRFPWKTGLVGLATAGLLGGVLVGALALRHVSAGNPADTGSATRAAATPAIVNPNTRITWLDDAGGIVPRPAADSPIVNPLCGPNDVTLSAAPERPAYSSAAAVMIRVDARFKGLQACFFKVACFPDVTVWDANGQHVWHANGEVAGACGGGTTAVLSQATQHVVMTVYWSQDFCWPFCNRDVAKPDPAAPAGKYTVSASWREFGSSPKSSGFQLQ